MYAWKGGIFRPGYRILEKMRLKQIISELREFYQKAEGGYFSKYMPDLEKAIEETLNSMTK